MPRFDGGGNARAYQIRMDAFLAQSFSRLPWSLPPRRAHSRTGLQPMRGDYATAMRPLRPLAEQGNADAQYKLGRMYDGLQGAPHDKAEAARWYAECKKCPFDGLENDNSRRFIRLPHRLRHLDPHRGTFRLAIALTGAGAHRIPSPRCQNRTGGESYLHILLAVSHTVASLRLSSSMERPFPKIEEAKPH